MITAYSDYFEGLATDNPTLNHQDTEGNKAFFSIDFEELLGSFKSGIREKGTALYLLNYQSGFENLNIEYCEGGFVVIGWFDKGVQGSKQSVLAATETVVLNLLAKMQKDSNALNNLFLDSFQTLNGIEKIPYQYQANPNYIGWLVTFKWRYAHNMNDYLLD